MADANNAAIDQEYNDDGSKNPDYKALVGSEGEGTGTENKGTGAEKKEGEEGAGEGEIEFDDTIDAAKPPEIPLRKFNAQHIIARQSDKIKKLQSKLKEGDEGYVPPEEDEGEEGEEDESELRAPAREAISKEVNKIISPLLGKMATEADENELKELISGDANAAKYVNHIKAYMSHEAYKGVSPAVIYHHLAFAAAQALGAKKKKAADLEASQGRSGGRTAGPDAGAVGDLPSAEEITAMSDADFNQMQEDALRGKFVKK